MTLLSEKDKELLCGLGKCNEFHTYLAKTGVAEICGKKWLVSWADWKSEEINNHSCIRFDGIKVKQEIKYRWLYLYEGKCYKAKILLNDGDFAKLEQDKLYSLED